MAKRERERCSMKIEEEKEREAFSNEVADYRKKI